MLEVILSFDDGRRDNYRAAFEILRPLNIPATFNITTGYVLNDIIEKDKPGPHVPMSVTELEELSSLGLFEIAGHGYTHDNNIDNLIDGVKKLRDMLPGIEINGIASPHSEFNLADIEASKRKFLENGIYYLRISNDYTKMSKVKIWIRRLNRILHLPNLYRWVNEDSIENEGKFLLHSIPVIKDNTLREVEGLIEYLIKNNAKEKRQICILMFHSILKPGEEYYNDLFSWDYDDFSKLCTYLSEQSEKGLISLKRTNKVIGGYSYNS